MTCAVYRVLQSRYQGVREAGTAMTYPVSAMERDARSELVSAAWACAYDLSPANRERWQQADEYFEALLEVLTPRGAPHERHVPPVGIPHAPTSVHL